MTTKLKKWKKVSTRLLFRNKYFDLHEDIVRLPNGALTKYYINNPHGRAVHVLAFDRKGHLLVTKEYRHPVGRVILGAVGGSVDRGESPRHAALRELKEETGFQASTCRLLGAYYANPARSGTVFYVYVATGLTPGPSRPEPAEIIEIEFLPLKRLDSMMKKGQVNDAYFMASYMLFRIKNRPYGHR
ncbi:MAG: NUDIX hydrolase [Patescibacteria group bacterium]